jgi:hypothetical protein
VKVHTFLRRILAAALVVVWALAPAWHASAQKGGPRLRDDVVAVVFTDAGTVRGTISVSYPQGVAQGQCERDLAAIESVTDWRFSPPGLEAGSGETHVTAVMRPAAHVGAYGDPVWPVVWALRRYNQVTIVVMGAAFEGRTGDLANKFVRLTRSGGGGMVSYDVAIRDHSFKGIADLSKAEAAPGPKIGGKGGDSAAAPMQRPWGYVLLLALVLGAAAYIVCLRLVRGPDPERALEARRMSAWRARRARNMLR